MDFPLPTLLDTTNFQDPYSRNMIPLICLAFVVQIVAAVPSILFRSELFYDFSGTITCVSCTVLSFWLPKIQFLYATIPSESFSIQLDSEDVGRSDWRQIALSGAVIIWSIRLGSCMFYRAITNSFQDSRFDGIRRTPLKFFAVFLSQVAWAMWCPSPVLAVNSIPTANIATLPEVTVMELLGFALFIGRFAYKVVADQQKNEWMRMRRNKQHDEVWVTRGLWRRSWLPNYFGESVFWRGITIVAGRVLFVNTRQNGNGWADILVTQYTVLTIVFTIPVFVTLLLLGVSTPSYQVVHLHSVF